MSATHDIRDAWRALLRSPGFTIPVILSLALALGVAVCAFSVINTLMLRTLPVPDAGRLYELTYVGEAGIREGSNYGWYEQVRDHARTVDAALVSPASIKVARNGRVEMVSAQRVSGNYFSTLGVEAQLGRLIAPADEPGSRPNRVAVISDTYWNTEFGRSRAALGALIDVDNVPHTIVGVTPPGFFGLTVGGRTDVTVPIDGSEYRRGWLSMPIVVRVRGQVTDAAAAAEVTTLLREFYKAAPAPIRAAAQRAELRPLANGLPGLRGRYADPAVAVLILVSLVLVLACANWALLLVARASGRRREMTIRLALGSTRAGLARRMVAESVMLSLAGGSAGFLAAWWTTGLLAGFLPDSGSPVDLQMVPDARVVVFAAGMSLVTGLLFAVGPAWLARTTDLSHVRAPGATQDARGSRLGRGLVVVQVALSLLLVTGAAFFIATLRNLQRQDMGFAGDGVLTFTLDADGTGIEGERLANLHRDILQRLRALPGARSATLATIAPLSGSEDGKGLVIPGFVPRSPDDLIAQMNTIAPGYFATFRMPIVRGRDITEADAGGAAKVALVSENAARFYFGGDDPIGRRLQLRGAVVQDVEIVGVVNDVMYDGLRSDRDRMFYVPFFQRPAEGAYTFAVRTEGAADALARRIPEDVRALAPGMPVIGLRTLERTIDDRSANERLLAAVSTAFGALALLLAAIGIYGIVAYVVSRRTPEFAVRLALGAGRWHIVWLTARGVVVVMALGLILGLAGALAARTLIASMLFGIPVTDARIYAVAAGLLAVTGALACVRPVVRALRIQPLSILRSD